jgi:hypothetical protein
MLKALAAAYPTQDPQIQPFEGSYRLCSPRFLKCEDALDVLNAANSLLPSMCGLLNLYGNYIGDVQARSAEWVDQNGRRGGIGDVADLVGNLVDRGALNKLCETSGGSPHTRAERLYFLSQTDPHFSALLRLAGGRQLTWGDLYVIYEILVDAAGGTRNLSAMGGISSNALRRFRDAANRVRHPSLRPRSDPGMHPHEALVLIRQLVRSWIDSRHPPPSV